MDQTKQDRDMVSTAVNNSDAFIFAREFNFGKIIEIFFCWNTNIKKTSLKTKLCRQDCRILQRMVKTNNNVDVFTRRDENCATKMKREYGIN